jgi:hypothetical protein
MDGGSEMTDFMRMAESVRAQAEAFLEAECVQHDASLPEMDDDRTLGDMLAAPVPDDRTTAALAAIRTCDAIRSCRLSWLTDIVQEKPRTENVERYAALAYRLRMVQDAMHSEELRRRYITHHAKKPRQKGSDREGSAAWLARLLTGNGRSVDDALGMIADSGKAEFSGLPVELLSATGEIITDGNYTGGCTVRYHFRDDWRSVTVKTLRKAARSLLLSHNKSVPITS